MFSFFGHILAPYPMADFFEQYHEREILHIERNDKNYYAPVLTSQEISAFLDRQDIFYPSLRIVKNGNEIPSSEYTMKGVPIGHHRKDGVIHTEKAFALFNQGSTLVVQAGQRYFDNLSKCCMALSKEFSSPVQANLYITPQRSVGFNPHWDTHDVLVLQISGTKTWKLYGFEKELPTKNQAFVSKGYSKQPIQTTQLKPGDFLYVPRGYVHDAMADDGISAHITIGVLSYTWARLFNEVFPQLEELKDFREAVPFWKNNLPELIKQKVEILKEALEGLDFDKGLERLRRQYHKVQPQRVNNYFQSLLDIGSLSATTFLALNDGIFLSLTQEGDFYYLESFDKKIQWPLSARPALNYILENRRFQMSELPATGEDAGIELLVEKLIMNGIVYIQQL